MHIILVHWKIRLGREEEFLRYWSTLSPVADRSGLIGEFLTRPDEPCPYPWINWHLDPSYSSFFNVGLWATGAASEEQFGQYIDDTRPPMPFEAQRRARILVSACAWRTGPCRADPCGGQRKASSDPPRPLQGRRPHATPAVDGS